jgi:poly(hydroxyalkanoate) depolymerase family esterase
MHALPKIDMIKATRLTREGRLAEAMAVLQGRQLDPSPTGSSTTKAGPPETPNENTPAILDMVPPSLKTGGAWRAPQANDGHAGFPVDTGPPQMPGATSGWLGRLGTRYRENFAKPGRQRTHFPIPDGARFEERSYANEAGTLSYKIYTPSGYDGRQALPLVVMLHGCTQSPDDFAAGTRMNDLAEEHRFLVAYPAQTPIANASKCWNWFSTDNQRRHQGEPSLLAGITRQVMLDFAVDRARVYIAGLSAGGAAAAIMGSTYPDLYAAIGVHSGLACGAATDVPSAFAAMRQGGLSVAPRWNGPAGAVPAIVFHGDTDTTVSPINADQVIAQSKAAEKLRSSVSRGESRGGIMYTRTVQVDEAGRVILEQWLLHGAGHAWSGGSAAGSYTEPRGPDASREMIRFFLQHPISSQPHNDTP